MLQRKIGGVKCPQQHAQRTPLQHGRRGLQRCAAPKVFLFLHEQGAGLRVKKFVLAAQKRRLPHELRGKRGRFGVQQRHDAVAQAVSQAVVRGIRRILDKFYALGVQKFQNFRA